MNQNKTGFLKICLLLFVAWMLDLDSTATGAILGIKEASPLFWLFPPMWLLLSLGLAALIYWFKWAPRIVRGTIMLAFILFCYVPAIRNSAAIILKVIT